MAIAFSCGQCGKRYSVPDQQAGKRGQCKNCGAMIVVPATAAGAPVAAVVEPPPPLPLAAYAVQETAAATAVKPARPVPALPPHNPYAVKTVEPDATSKWMPWAVSGALLVLLIGIAVGVINPAIQRARRLANRAAGRTVASAPVFPAALPPATAVAPGVQCYPLHFTGTGPAVPMDAWLYLPAGSHPNHSLPCVFVAPAGTRLIHGLKLSDGDRAEHLPYARAGFAVMAYDLSGDYQPASDSVKLAELRPAAERFMDANGGVANASVAIDYVLANVPEVDPNQLFAAGHSSAATVALDVASYDARVRAVAAYAPCCDIARHWGAKLDRLDAAIPGVGLFCTRASPVNRANHIACPVFLFHADDDNRVPTADNQAFAAAMRLAGNPATFVRSRYGGHFDSMIHQGIPGGIAFFKSNGATPAPPAVGR